MNGESGHFTSRLGFGNDTKMEHHGMIRLDWCERELRFGSFIRGGRSRLTDGRSEIL